MSCSEKEIYVLAMFIGQNPYLDMNNSLKKVVHIIWKKSGDKRLRVSTSANRQVAAILVIMGQNLYSNLNESLMEVIHMGHLQKCDIL